MSRATPKVPAVPLNDQHAPVESPKTADGGVASKPSVVSLRETTAPVFKEAKLWPLVNWTIGENAV